MLSPIDAIKLRRLPPLGAVFARCARIGSLFFTRKIIKIVTA